MTALNTYRKKIKPKKTTPVTRENLVAAMASKSLPAGWKLLVSQTNPDIMFIQDETDVRYAISKEELLLANFDILTALTKKMQAYLDENHPVAAE